jgi:large repetitive protein
VHGAVATADVVTHTPKTTMRSDSITFEGAKRMRVGIRRGLAALCAALMAAPVVLTMQSEPAAAAPTVPFTPKFTTNANGAITTIGNNLLTCRASTSCMNARNGATADNNGFVMVNLDTDNVAGTTNSSSSQLALPEGASVLWAGLYWGGRLQAGSGGQGGSAVDIATMSFRAPGDASYRTVDASTAAHDQFGPNSQSNNAYQRFADVTSIVRAAGNGDYWGANVAAATGEDRYAGWAMTVVFSAPGLPLRNLTVFDGFDVVGRGSPQNVDVSGFLAPQSGPVDAQLTMVAYEGDLAQTGDFTRLNSTQLGTPLSPGSNFFNSTNDVSGTSVPTRTPAHRNMLGFDIKNMGASGAIPNGATEATFTFSSNGDVYYPGVVGLAINLYAPDLTSSAKSVVNVNGNSPSRPGDTLQYTVRYNNTGQDAAVQAVSEDVLPPNTTYVPDSLRYLAAPGVPPAFLTDDVGDDRGEIDGGTVRVRVGTGATTTTGGTIAIGASPAYSFRVTLDEDAGGTTVTNSAELSYRTATTGTAAVYTTNPASVDVVQQADVSITKDMTPDPTAVGGQLQATLTVGNAGPNTATGVTVTDPIPAGWGGVTATATQGSCTVSDGTVTCSLGDVADGATAEVTLRGTTASSSTATALTNVASVTTTAFDPAPSNNVSADTITLTRQADLSVTKTPSPASAPAGSPVTWTVTATNDGASDAQNVLISDAIDVAGQATMTGAVLDAASVAAGGTCTQPTGRAVRCAVPTLAAGASATVTITGRLATDLAAGTTVTDTAAVASGTPDPSTSNNSATAAVTVTDPEADLRVAKTGPASVTAGQAISWTVTATNFGPSDAPGVVVTDTVPAGVTDVMATPSRGTCTVTDQTVSCDAGALPAGAPGEAGAAVTVTITGTVDPEATGTLTNEASATSTADDPAEDDNTATADTTVTASYDLAVSKSANRTTLPGQAPRPVTYTITVTNNGPSAARDITVTDLTPLALTLLSATSDDGTCDTSQATTPQPPPDDTQGLITCDLPGPLAPGESAFVTVAMRADTVLAQGPDVDERVTISDAAGADTNPDNDAASWTLTGLPFVDLSLGKSADTQVTAGEPATYTFVVANNNDPDDVDENLAAIQPIIRDTLPAGVSFTSAVVTAPSDGSQDVACGTSGQDLTCQLTANVNAGSSATVEVTVAVAPDVAAGSTLVNTASVETGDMTNNPDNNLANNTSQATSNVAAQADPAVTELTLEPVDPGSTGPGSLRNVHISLTNNGPSTARDVTFRLARTVDAFVVDTGTQPFNCTNTAREVVCTIDGADIAPGASVDVDYVIQVAPYAEPGEYPDTVEVASSTPDSDTGNNVMVDDIVVGPAQTDLAVTKTPVGTVANPADGHDSFVAGGPFAYQFEVVVPEPGTGLADAQDVVLRDVLPVGFTAQQASTSRGSCTITPAADPTETGDTLECDLGTVPGWSGTTPPAPTVVTVHGVLDPDANDLNGGDEWAEAVENTAAVTTGTDLVGGEDEITADAVVDIVEIADLQIVKAPDEATVNAGGTIGYTLTVINAGPSGVEHAVVTDSLPVGFTLDTGQSECPPPQTTPEDETQAQPQVPDGPGVEIACRVGVVDAGQSASIHVVARTSPTMDETPAATNTATVGSLANEADPANNTATADVAVERLVDLALSSSASTTTPAAGQDITFTGFAVNNGPSTALNTSSDTVFPVGFVPVSFDVPFNDCSWSPTPPVDPATAPWEDVAYTLHCEPLAPPQQFDAGATATNVVVMHIPDDTPAGTYSGTSTVRSETPETELGNNTTQLELVVQHVSDLSVVKDLVDPDPMRANRPATWRLTLTNDGPSVADNVVVSDAVPAGMRFVSAEVEGGAACPPPEQSTAPTGDTATILRCPLGTMDVGDSASIVVTFQVDPDQAGADLCNEAIVGSGSLDPEAADNEDEACGTIVEPLETDVALALAPPSQTHRSGDTAELTATVRNNGDGQATDVVATLDTPPGLTGYSGVASEWPAGRPQPPDGVVGSLTFDVGDLAVGEQVVYRIVGTATGRPGDVLTVDGVVTHGEPDSVPPNNVDDAEILIVGAPTPTSPPPSGTVPPSQPSPVPPTPPGEGSPSLPLLPRTGAGIAGLLFAALAATAAGMALLRLRRRHCEA